MTQTDRKRVIIIDALNMFIRAYIVDPSLSTNGAPIGGIKGTMKIMQKLVRMTQPDEVLVVWDGPNGSAKRKNIDKSYKAGRKPLRLNRSVHNLTDDQIILNKIWQQSRVVDYLNEMPIMQLMLPEIEADDVIAYACSLPRYDGWQKVVISNDKDFYQLANWSISPNENLMAYAEDTNGRRQYKIRFKDLTNNITENLSCLLYTSPSPRD